MENNNKRGFFSHGEPREDLMPEDTTPTFSYFFKLLWRKAGKLLSLNLMMLPLVLPIVACFFLYFFSSATMPSAESTLYAPLLGVHLIGESPTANLMLSIFGKQLDMPVLTPARGIIITVLIGFLFLTWGFQNVGISYNLRSLVRGDSCFLFSDYFYAVKKNWKQGFFFGLFDFIVIAVLSFDIFYFSTLSGEKLAYGIMYFMTIAIAILYIIMRFYLYLMMITFDLSFRKLMKNALIFTMLGVKRNLVALLALVLLVVLNVVLITMGLSIGLTFPILLPFFYLPVLMGFISAYAAYPNIQRYMIDAYKNKGNGDSNSGNGSDEDRGGDDGNDDEDDGDGGDSETESDILPPSLGGAPTPQVDG